MSKVKSAALLVILLLRLLAMPANAAGTEIAPFLDNASTVSCVRTLNGTIADCCAKMTGYSGTTSIQGTMTLYRLVGSSWVSVKSWSGSFASAALTLALQSGLEAQHIGTTMLNV